MDIIPDELGNDRTNYPLTLYGVAGSQTEKSTSNSIIVFKMHNLHEIKRKSKAEDSEDDESDEEEDDPEKQPKLKVSGIKHNAGIKIIIVPGAGTFKIESPPQLIQKPLLEHLLKTKMI